MKKKKDKSPELNRFLSSMCIFLVGVVVGIVFTFTVDNLANKVTVVNYEDSSHYSDVNIPKLKEKIQSSKEKNTEKPKNTIININSATFEDFCSLPGIGEKTAQNIIDYRFENGYFETKRDIMNVKGIGESLYKKIKDSITI